MSTDSPIDSTPRRGRSVVAILAGLFAVVALSLGTDQLMHVLGVYPPWGQPMPDPGDNFLALGYRCVYAVFGSYLAARLAPDRPMGHAMVLGFIGLALASVGAVVSIARFDLGPAWYPISLVITSLPCAWVGGALHLRGRT